MEIQRLSNGTVTSPRGFLGGATYAGLKTYGPDKLDLGILFSEEPETAAAGVFTLNRIKSPSVVLSQQHIASGRARALVVNSGCANTGVGEQGFKDAQEVVAITARKLQLDPQEVLICSTGIIGVELPMSLIRQALDRIQLSKEGGHDLARAILTTDTRPKEMAITLQDEEGGITIGGIAKGSGMIHPEMATMLAFVTTDAPVEGSFLQKALRRAVDLSFNMITVDGDSSPNDSVILLANGAAGGQVIREGSPQAQAFQEALCYICTELAKEIVRDGEGATKLLEVRVEGAVSEEEARRAARTVASSLLVKTALHGADPNWGRIMAALGRSGIQVEESRVSLYINDVCIMEDGKPIPFFREAVVAIMRGPEVSFKIRLNLGEGQATAWGCDLSEEYVTFNSAYTT